ncbi:uncharacterized protein MELLADRAFT_105229 [Melampsora larici-populina 98AG31]|uniref:CxC1-like cysteine cluster associated with KDZ transposases domain-containing protein n=1 Tax=Melampsora larici-populina (strain 98AG31 / pathotype 3-4-7) TaxID=747676 RepID=F4RH98_MELLP|nr:uncharacterized protein MELLADRAFT_105229 [Melampsora larici-populina 98AG31]EGG08291.1 hypothetical protein MELLADRAFT_105229 [Melampsora larici-populina 98AG31]
MTPQKAQSISASLGIAIHPVPGTNEDLDGDSLDNLELNQFLPLPDEPEAPASSITDAAHQSLIHDRDLRRQFTSSVNMYRTIVLCMRKIYNEGLKLSNAQLLVDRCGRCFGPAINEEPHVILRWQFSTQTLHLIKQGQSY